MITASPVQADTIRSRQWHLNAMHAEEMWQMSTGTGVTVAVIDTGVDASLTDLRGQVLAGRDFTSESGNGQTDTDGHGTHMAALIAATGKKGGDAGSYGLAPGAKILPLRVGGKNYAQDTQAIVAALRYAAESDAKVINISLATPGRNELEEKAIAYALNKGKMIVAGVGNTGDKTNMAQFPAAYPGVIGVAGLDQNGSSASWSQRGPQVDLSAPGVDAVSACPGSTEVCKGSGTSAASALTSASAALIWSAHPNWTANQVARVLINTAGGTGTAEKRNDYVGYGAVRPRIALKDPGDPGPADVNPLPGPTPVQDPKGDGAKPAVEGAPKDSAVSAAGSGSGSGNGSPAKWIALGAGAAVLVGAAVTTPILLARRRNAARRPW
ncbi:type VII secretion-associated serine protease mycosin [Streptomyces roseifaciens]